MRIRNILLGTIAILVATGCSDGDDPRQPVSVTYLGNDGILIEAGDTKIVVDALQTIATTFIPVPPDELDRLERGEPPFDGVDLALVTHVHADHFDARSVQRFLDNNPQSRLIAPPQVRAALADTEQVDDIAPEPGMSADIQIAGARIRVLHTEHFNQFGLDFSDIENFAYLIDIGSQRLLHAGDINSTVENLEPFTLANEGIDVAFLPTFAEQLTTEIAAIVEEQIAPNRVVGLHLLESVREEEAEAVMDLYSDGFAFTTPLDQRTFE